MEQYAIYLRKSRKDDELEALGEGETLARHKKTLTDYAAKRRLAVGEIYEEVVSGDTIAARPVMQRLLADVGAGMWRGVLVMEIERLARGDTMDQGLVSQTFKFSNTLIVTPMKTYDPNDEFDEEYFEFGLFMSRREYKTINRRLQRGRLASVSEGKFLGSRAPYGYERVKIPNGKGYTLTIDPEKAEVIRLIFSLYVDGIPDENGEKRRRGIQAVARKLNQMQIPPSRNEYWEKASIRDILMNPTYAGKIRWGWRKTVKSPTDGTFTPHRPRNYNDDCMIAEGLHEAIVSSETFEKAQKYLSECPAPPVGYKNEVKSPLAGLILCGRCGRKMSMRRATALGKPDYLVCHSRVCDNVSAPLSLVEDRLLVILEQWLGEYRLAPDVGPDPSEDSDGLFRKTIEHAEKKLARLEKQLGNLHDLLERGVYSAETFFERSKNISDRINEAKAAKKEAENRLKESSRDRQSPIGLTPKIERLLKVYDGIDDAADKNKLLKEIVDHGVYTKEISGSRRGASADGFALALFPRLPK